MKKRKPTRGGARPGAGHPTTTGSAATAPVSFRISAADRATAEAIAKARRLTVNALAREALLGLLVGNGSRREPG